MVHLKIRKLKNKTISKIPTIQGKVELEFGKRRRESRVDMIAPETAFLEHHNVLILVGVFLLIILVCFTFRFVHGFLQTFG